MRRSTMVEIVCLVSIAAFAACQPSQPVDAAAKQPEQLPLDAQQQQQVAEPEAPTVTVKAVQPKKAIAKDVDASASSKTLTIKQSSKSAEATPVMTSAPALESRSAAKQDGEESITTTISGCLVRDDGMFQLKDTAGDHAPKSRSWKSGFIKKGSARVDLVDASNRLAPHVGYRVTVSGTLTDREMQVNLVRGTTERCD